MSPSNEGLARLMARRIGVGISRDESPREIADGLLVLVRERARTANPADLSSVAELAPAVAAIVDAAEAQAQREIVAKAAEELRQQAVLRFDEHGSDDVRGAALWDAASHLNPLDGDALKVGSAGVAAPYPECVGHLESQHRDHQIPWCNACGWNRGHPARPARKIGTPRSERG